jgi:hypothetical protein
LAGADDRFLLEVIAETDVRVHLIIL